MIPNFTTEGLLPAGLHWSDWEEIQERFGINSHRCRLLSGLGRAIGFLASAGCPAVFLDGSFVTAKHFPADYDVCWETTGVDLVELRSKAPALLSFVNQRALQKAYFLGEFFPANTIADTASPFRTFLEFFQQDKTTGMQKGIVGYRFGSHK